MMDISEPIRNQGCIDLSVASSPCSTVPLPDGIVIGGPWPNTIIAWPGGKSRLATKPEYDLFQALEKAHTEIEVLRALMPNASEVSHRQKKD